MEDPINGSNQLTDRHKEPHQGRKKEQQQQQQQKQGNVASSGLWYWVNFAAFMVMGAGANWVLPTVLAQEIPYFENHSPEGLCIATYMNVANACGVIAMLSYMYIHNYIRSIPYSYSVPCLLLGSTIGSFFSGFTYFIVIGGVSLLLYFCCFVGGAIGSLSSVVMNPFMTGFEGNFISAGRSGGSFYIVLCALVALPQDPGSSHVTFSPMVYFVIFGILLAPSIFAYRYIALNNIGKRLIGDQELSVTSKSSASTSLGGGILDTPTSKPSSSTMLSSSISTTASAAATTTTTATTIPSSASSSTCAAENSGLIATTGSPMISMDGDTSNVFKIEADDMTKNAIFPVQATPSGIYPFLVSLRNSGQAVVDRLMLSLGCWLVSPERHQRQPYLRRSIPFMLTVGWINFNTWGMITSLTPFAMAFASKGNGSVNLALAYELGGIGLVCGDFSTTLFTIPTYIGVALFTFCCIIIYAAATGTEGFHTTAGPPFLIMIFSFQRFIEAHVITSTYRSVAASFPDGMRQLASGAVGVTDVCGTTCGAMLSLAIVVTQYSC